MASTSMAKPLSGISNALHLSLALLASMRVQTALAAEQFDPTFYSSTGSWEGICTTGEKQSPINLPARFEDLPRVPDTLVTNVRMPLVKDPRIVNEGHAIQITWDTDTAFDMEDDEIFPLLAAGGTGVADVMLDPSVQPDRMVKMIPIQLHWHETSEHSWDGMLAAAETHIVTLVGPGEAPEWGCDDVWQGGDAALENCTAVFGILYRLGDSTDLPGYLESAIKETPIVAGEDKPLSAGKLNVDNILPDDRSYYTYVGSLTTPGCNEGLRWHVLNEQEHITPEMMQSLEGLHARTVDSLDGGPRQNYRHNNRPVQPLNGRTIYFHNTGNAAHPGTVSASAAPASILSAFAVLPAVVSAAVAALALV